MDKQSFIIGIAGVLIVGGLAIFLTRSNNESEPAIEIAEEESVSELNLENIENQQPTSATIKEAMTDQKQPPAMQIDSSKTYTAVLDTTQGPVTIAFHADKTPITVNNFVSLAREGFYDGTIFHRTIPGFMIQGGDPEGTGRGGPGYRFADEPFEGKYTKGTVAMANAGPDTNGSQFFIMHDDYALPPNYVIFGQVTEGLEVVDKIADAPTQPGGEGSTPVSPVKVTKVTITEK